MEIELIRRYGYAMLNIYIPSLTLLVISYVTLYFRPSIFEVRVMTALTSLLVLATLFTQVSASLPKTSYFKMVDIWLLFCIFVIFFIILFHTVIDLQVDYGDSFLKGQPMLRKEGIPSLTPVMTIDSKDGVEFTIESKGSIWQYIKHWFSVILKLDNIVLISKATIFLIFLFFNLIYWGILAISSGLVYTYD